MAGWIGMLGMISVLSACGGGSDNATPATSGASDANPASSASPASGASSPTAALSNKVLLVDMDGVTYAALQQAVAAGAAPNLAKLHYAPVYSGGGQPPSQQPNLDAPGWASILTGTWANRHQVYSDASKQEIQADTVFKTLKAATTSTPLTVGAAVGSPRLAGLLKSDNNAGYLGSLVNCARVDTCVTQNALNMIGNGNSLVLAQYHSAEDVALSSGFNTDYSNAVAQLDAALGTLQSAIAKRTSDNWLVLVTTSHGLNAAGGADGLPLLAESTSFIAMNQADNGLLGTTTAPTLLADLEQRASIADITPTILAYFNALPAAATYGMDGGELIGQTPVSNVTGTTGSDHASAVLNWTAPTTGAITVLRNGTVIANLPAGTTTYTDSQLGLTASGTYSFDYTIAAGAAPVSTVVQVAYIQVVPPPTLAPTLKNGLVSYYPFGTLPPVDKLNASQLTPWATDADGGSLVTDPFGGKGLQIDTSIVDSNGFDGYKLTQTSDVTKQPQFTIGMWFRTDCSKTSGNGTPVISNKNYFTGKNPGVTIGLFNGSSNATCNVRFNVADGSTRQDVTSFNLTSNQWAYLAVTIDQTAKLMNAYVFDAVLGEQKSVGTTLTINLSKLPGLGVFGLAEDGTGNYYMNSCNDKPPYTVDQCTLSPPIVQDFSDLALWNRVVSEAELQTVYGSGKPLSTLNP